MALRELRVELVAELFVVPGQHGAPDLAGWLARTFDQFAFAVLTRLPTERLVEPRLKAVLGATLRDPALPEVDLMGDARRLSGVVRRRLGKAKRVHRESVENGDEAFRSEDGNAMVRKSGCWDGTRLREFGDVVLTVAEAGERRQVVVAVPGRA